jgi:8-amino-7-oxononanoate synthase
VLDFTSALYLGIRQDHRALSRWGELTSGVPAVLVEPPGADAVAATLARRMGFARGILGPSTLHLFHDVFERLALKPVVILLDAGLYPIARWGAERAALVGRPVREVSHHDAAGLRRAIARCHPKQRPVVVVDGFCPGCGRVAPLAEYLEAARARGGWLIVDDTQALGVLGRDPTPSRPYGRDGGGSLPHLGIDGAGVLVVSSLAKGWGAPVAVAAGDDELVAQLADAPTRVHCSPPSAVSIGAAAHALLVDALSGAARRRRLLAVVRRFREGLTAAGLSPLGGAFPMQRLRLGARDVATIFQRLEAAGVRAVMLRARCTATPELSLLFTTRHRDDEIDTAVAELARAVRNQPTRESCIHYSRPSIG